MKKLLSLLASCTFALFLAVPGFSHAASAGIFASGGGSKTAGTNFTITVTASGTSFDSVVGTIKVTGPVTIVSFSPGSATWLPGYTPANGKGFAGLTSATSSLTVAQITLRGNSDLGSGSVTVSGVQLAKSGSIVGTAAGSTSFTITRAPVYPGGVTVTSPSHPDQGQAYEATTIALQWNKENGVSGFGYVLDQNPDTAAPQSITSADTSVTYADKAIGTYYFHIRAKNGDGWGGTTTFKVTIKEPDPKVNGDLIKPAILKIHASDTFATDLVAGTVSNFTIGGTAQPGYSIDLHFTPTLTSKDPLALTAVADDNGQWTVAVNQPVTAGFYTVTMQGQKDKVLTPLSDPVHIELYLAKGGGVQFITEADAVPTPTPIPTPTSDTGLSTGQKSAIGVGGGGLATVLIVTSAVALHRRRKGKKDEVVG
jgi:hypothetical protein